ncbi:MBL fold metallo-hydrolase [Allokutzneria oryzae]|uniref:MBL fold metallo-hydrolase n=1 Tax=Allokutzneria oryzae TaxID=1378989 RepID=A0ABV5ZP58_9PSEU
MSEAQFRVLGGPTVLIEVGGLRLLTDPTFDGPGDYPGEVPLTKTAPSRLAPADLGRLDAVLLSHDQHADNLDISGRELLGSVPTVLTTPSGGERLGGTARGMAAWETHDLARPDGGVLTVTAVPAQHGPDGCEPLTGEVTGFVLTAPDVPAIYVSGDNASLPLVEQIAERFGPVDTAVLFAGAVRTSRFDGALLTLDSELAAKAAAALGARRVVPAHLDSWAHFTEGLDEFVAAFTAAGLADRLVL